MSTGIDFSCIEDFKKRLEEMGKQGAKLEKRALEEGAKPILEEMERTSSFSDRTGRLRKALKISKVATSKGNKYIKIGIQKDDNSEVFYGKFIEYGTSTGLIARPFMRPAFERKRKEALEKTKDVIREGLGL